MMQVMAMVIAAKPKKLYEYKRLHAAFWPDVLAQIAKSYIRNYTIILRQRENLLFGYWEYHDTDFKGDMAAWRKTPKRGNGGVSPTLAKTLCPAAPKASNGRP